INVNGAQGGNMSNGGLHGPGGGGGGGGVLYSGSSLPASVTFSAEGGVSGRCTAFTDAVQAAHLSKPGDPGSVAFRAVIPENTTPKPVLGVTILSDTTICPNQTVQLSLRTAGAVARIEWSELNGKSFSTSSVVDVQPTRTTAYVVTISDQTGCTALDTATVTVLDGWKGLARPIDLGDVFCDKFIDTSLVVVNLGSAPGFVSKVASTNPNAFVSDTLPLRIGARDCVRIRMRIATGNRAGPNTASVSVTLSPCDSVVTTTITWNRQNRLNSLTPRDVRMPEIYSCMGATRDTIVDCRITGSSGTARQIIGEGSVTSTTTVPFPVADGVPFALALTWIPTAQQSQGRAGIVFEFEGCYDTLWVRVDGKVQMPRMSAPDTIGLPDVVLCEGRPAVVDVPLTSIDSTTWVVDSIIAPVGVTLDIAPGDSLRGVRVVKANVLPTALGRYAVLVAIRLIPCDTIITVVLVGNAIDASLTHTDTLVFTQPVIGRKQRLTARFVNSGDVPIDILSVEPPSPRPFAFITSRPLVPCSLRPGDVLECDVEIIQRYGKHVDSLVLVTTNPCMPREKVVLISEAYATTRLYMPDISSGIGRTELVPVLMDGRPLIDSTLLDSFSLQIVVRSADLAVGGGSSARCIWSTNVTDSLTQISVDGRWLGGDTLAVLPMKTLLSSSTTTPLVFVRQPEFRWKDQPCDVEYRDGSIMLGDICSGRLIRLVSIGQARPVFITPNPASDVVAIQPDTSVFDGVYEITLYDALGSVMFRVSASNESRIDVSSIPTGMYMICISDTSTVVSLPFIRN
ncbi:MAG: T9SS type A sorting domain-containing protein, partial [Ignavibacteria bacterium]